MVLRGRNFTSNAIGSPLCGRNSISNAVGSPLRRRNFISNAVGSPLRGHNSISNAVGSPLCGRNSISNAVGSLLRGRNGISNVFGRRHAITKQLRHEVNCLLLRAVTMFFVFENYPNKSSVSCSRSASCFRRWRLPCGVMISSLSKRVRMTVVTT